MSRYLLDTMVLSEGFKKQPNRGLDKWLRSVNEDETYLSVLTVGEIQKGVARLSSSDPRKTLLQRWLVFEIIPRFNKRMLSFDVEVARHWGNLVAVTERRGVQLPTVDSLIAATASLHGLTVVTRNEQDFAHPGVHTLNPWT